MSHSLQSLITSGTKLWLDSIDPDLVKKNIAFGATGATSNPIIVAALLASGRFDHDIQRFASKTRDAEAVAWLLTDDLVTRAEREFFPIWEQTKGNDGYVSFELDPLIEDHVQPLSHQERVKRYVALAKQWGADHPNRLIKVPATPAGIASLTDIVAAGINVNVTLIFSQNQYIAARTAVLAGAQHRPDLKHLKSVYSIFVSRLDVYAEKYAPKLSAEAMGQVGILNAKRVWLENQKFWQQHKTPLQQEMIFASTGTKKPTDVPWKYVAAFAGSDIETNPPETNDAVAKSGLMFSKMIDQMPAGSLIQEIDQYVDWEHLAATLMQEGLEKFAEPQKKLIQLMRTKIN